MLAEPARIPLADELPEGMEVEMRRLLGKLPMVFLGLLALSQVSCPGGGPPPAMPAPPSLEDLRKLIDEELKARGGPVSTEVPIEIPSTDYTDNVCTVKLYSSKNECLPNHVYNYTVTKGQCDGIKGLTETSGMRWFCGSAGHGLDYLSISFQALDDVVNHSGGFLAPSNASATDNKVAFMDGATGAYINIDMLSKGDADALVLDLNRTTAFAGGTGGMKARLIIHDVHDGERTVELTQPLY